MRSFFLNLLGLFKGLHENCGSQVVTLDHLRDASAEGQVLDKTVLDVGHVEDELDHVGLLAIVVLVVIIIDDHLVTVRGVHGNVGKVLHVARVRQQVVPVNTLDGLLGDLGVIALILELLADEWHPVGLIVVVVLLDDPVSLGKLDGVKEVRQVLVNLDLVLAEPEAPFLQLLLEALLEEEDDKHRDGDEQGRDCLVDLVDGAEIVASDHDIVKRLSQVEDTFEHLTVAEHPVSVEEEENGGELENRDGVLGELVVKGRRKLVGVGHMVSLEAPEDHVVEDGDGEQDGHAHTVHQRDEGDVEHRGVLEMNNVLGSRVEGNVLTDLSLLGLVHIVRPAVIQLQH